MEVVGAVAVVHVFGVFVWEDLGAEVAFERDGEVAEVVVAVLVDAED